VNIRNRLEDDASAGHFFFYLWSVTWLCLQMIWWKVSFVYGSLCGFLHCLRCVSVWILFLIRST